MAQREETGEQLENEEPEDPTRDEIEEWLSIYDQLISFTEEMMERTRRYMEDVPGPAYRHLETTNVRVMNEELAVFRERRSALQRRRVLIAERG